MIAYPEYPLTGKTMREANKPNVNLQNIVSDLIAQQINYSVDFENAEDNMIKQTISNALKQVFDQPAKKRVRIRGVNLKKAYANLLKREETENGPAYKITNEEANEKAYSIIQDTLKMFDIDINKNLDQYGYYEPGLIVGTCYVSPQIAAELMPMIIKYWTKQLTKQGFAIKVTGKKEIIINW